MYNNPLLNTTAQDYLFTHEQEDEQKLILKNQPVAGVDAKIMATQLVGRRKAKEKLPLWYSTKNIVYPPSLNLEQCSSQATALFKKMIIEQTLSDHLNSSAADLTGGFGVDSFFLHDAFKKLSYVEPDEALLALVRHNHAELGASTIDYYPQTAESFLVSTSPDFIFIDPSRRKQQQKVFKLADTQPDVTTLQKAWLSYAKGILIKTSPMLDIAQGLMELQSVKKIWVVAYGQECKEVLFWQEPGWQQEPQLTAVEIDAAGLVKSSFSFTIQEEREASASYSSPQQFLYEPNAALMKSGAFKLIAQRLGLFKVDTHTHLYTSSVQVHDFPGRVFKIVNLHVTEQTLQTLPDRKANVLTRNFPQGAEMLKKKLKVNDGGEHYLIAYTHQNQKFISLAIREK